MFDDIEAQAKITRLEKLLIASRELVDSDTQWWGKIYRKFGQRQWKHFLSVLDSLDDILPEMVEK